MKTGHLFGRVASIRNHYNERSNFKSKGTDRQLVIRFRLFDDGSVMSFLRKKT
jgi:hypothetical protein